MSTYRSVNNDRLDQRGSYRPSCAGGALHNASAEGRLPMYAQSIATAALALSLLAPSVATAQASQSLDQPTIVLFANGGGNSSLTDLNDAGTSSLKTGWTAGGGAGVQLNRYVALR